MSTNIVWNAYVTSGRDKYETTIMGTFTKRYLACRALFNHLCDTKRLFSFREEDEKEYQRVYTEMMTRTRSAYRYLKDCVEKYNDSFYKDGWDYTVEKQSVCQSWNDPTPDVSVNDENTQLAITSSLELTPNTSNLLSEDVMITNINQARARLGIPPLSQPQPDSPMV